MKELKAVEILTLMQRVDDVSTRQMQKEINEALVELQELTQEKSCEWTDENDGYFDGYKTACGQIQYFGEGEISDNKYKFCPYCGGNIDYTPKR
jgi:Mor family transcriptional regulator